MRLLLKLDPVKLAMLALLAAPAAHAQPAAPEAVQSATPAAPPAVVQAGDCPASPTQRVSLPHLRQALADNKELVIVALGSSSTQSWMSSDIGHSYPAVLQEALDHALPQSHVAVINRGIGGQDAAEEVPRLQNDVLAVRPQLVIWQVGANGALRDTDPAVFKHLVSAGLALIQGTDADVILMDNQRAPMILASPEHAAMDQALADLAIATGASLFSRGALMDTWQQEGAPYGRFISSDNLHQNDLGYRCVAQALAATIVSGLRPTLSASNHN